MVPAERDLRRFRSSRAWQAARLRALARDGVCRTCLRDDYLEVDHVVPLHTEAGWRMRLELDNLRTLCRRCHRLHTRADGPRRSGRDYRPREPRPGSAWPR
jgi:5-methylcytosine-specific restriction endonuclease McrA